MVYHYLSTKLQHAKNEYIFCNMGLNIMAHMVVVGDVVRKRKMKFL
jgi:hypothetical protein